MAVTRELRLHEELLLMALHDKKGTVAAGGMHSYALAGAVLAELLLHNRIAVEEEGKKKFVKAISSSRTRDDLLDACLDKIRTAPRRATFQRWVSRFARLKGLRHRVATSLCRRGILRADEDTILLLFRRAVYPQVDPRPERRLMERVRDAVFSDTADVEPRTVVLVSLAHGTGLLAHALGKKEVKRRKQRLSQLTRGEIVGGAAEDARDAVQAALVISSVLPSVIAASAHSH